MPDNPESPFGHRTVKLRAVFVPEDAKHNVSRADISRTVGYGSPKIPAVFVPEGGNRPGHPYQYVGKAVFSRTEDRDDARKFTARRPSWQSPDAEAPSPDEVWESLNFSSQGPDALWQSADSSSQSPDPSAQSPDAEEQGREPDAALPQTRYRFGAALSDNPPVPPNPTLSGGKTDPFGKGVQVSPAIIAAGIAAWRNMANPGKTWRQSLAALAPAQGAQGSVSTAAAGPPTRQLSRAQPGLSRPVR